MRPPVSIVTNAKTLLGQAVVRRLAFAGHNVAAVDSCKGSVSKIAEDNRNVGAKVTGFAVDLSSSSNREQLFQRVTEEFGGLDSLVIVPPKNCHRGDIIETSSMQFDAMLDLFLTIPFRLVQVAMPILKQSENPGIVFVTSAAGYSPQVDGGLHSVASASILGLVKSLAQSVAKDKVRVNGVCTGMVEGDGSGSFWDDLSNKHGEEFRENLQAIIPLARIGRPSDVGPLVEFLLSERARYITGENIILNGGVSYRI